MTPVLTFAVDPFVRLTLTLLLRGSTGSVTAPILATLAVVALVRAGAVALMIMALTDGSMWPFFLLASVGVARVVIGPS